MQQIIDPKQGFNRQKSLLQRVAQKAMTRKGYKSKVGAFGKLASGGLQNRGLKPNRGPGSGILGAARPGGFGNFFDGMNINPRGGGQAPRGYANTAPVAAAAPTALPMQPAEAYTSELDPVAQGSWTGENPMPAADNPYAGQTMTDQSGTYTVPENYDPTPEPGMSIWGVPLEQGSPSGQITAPGGLIPLGGGVYYDPATGQVHGGGVGGSGGLNAKAM